MNTAKKNIAKIIKRVSEGAEDECLSTKHAAIVFGLIRKHYKTG